MVVFWLLHGVAAGDRGVAVVVVGLVGYEVDFAEEPGGVVSRSVGTDWVWKGVTFARDA